MAAFNANGYLEPFVLATQVILIIAADETVIRVTDNFWPLSQEHMLKFEYAKKERRNENDKGNKASWITMYMM